MKKLFACLLVAFAFVACGGEEASDDTPAYQEEIEAAAQAGAESRVESGLKNAATAQEAYFVDNMTYSTSLKQLEIDMGLKVPVGVTVDIADASDSGYCMTATHESLDATNFVDSETLEPAEGDC